jgi:hypothetical protein
MTNADDLERENLPSEQAIEHEHNGLTPRMRKCITPQIDPLALKCLINDAKRQQIKRWKTLGIEGNA